MLRGSAARWLTFVVLDSTSRRSIKRSVIWQLSARWRECLRTNWCSSSPINNQLQRKKVLAVDVHEHDFWRKPGGTLECSCGASKRPLEAATSVPSIEVWLLPASQTVFEALTVVAQERACQDARWGEQNHPDGTGPETMPLYAATATGFADDDEAHFIRDVMCGRTDWRFKTVADRPGTWADVLLEEVFEAMAEDDPVKLVGELTQVAAVAVAWVEAIERRLRESGEVDRG
jgi:hypothetical protein